MAEIQNQKTAKVVPESTAGVFPAAVNGEQSLRTTPSSAAQPKQIKYVLVKPEDLEQVGAAGLVIHNADLSNIDLSKANGLQKADLRYCYTDSRTTGYKCPLPGVLNKLSEDGCLDYVLSYVPPELRGYIIERTLESQNLYPNPHCSYSLLELQNYGYPIRGLQNDQPLYTTKERFLLTSGALSSEDVPFSMQMELLAYLNYPSLKKMPAAERENLATYREVKRELSQSPYTGNLQESIIAATECRYQELIRSKLTCTAPSRNYVEHIWMQVYQEAVTRSHSTALPFRGRANEIWEDTPATERLDILRQVVDYCAYRLERVCDELVLYIRTADSKRISRGARASFGHALLGDTDGFAACEKDQSARNLAIAQLENCRERLQHLHRLCAEGQVTFALSQLEDLFLNTKSQTPEKPLVNAIAAAKEYATTNLITPGEKQTSAWLARLNAIENDPLGATASLVAFGAIATYIPGTATPLSLAFAANEGLHGVEGSTEYQAAYANNNPDALAAAAGKVRAAGQNAFVFSSFAASGPLKAAKGEAVEMSVRLVKQAEGLKATTQPLNTKYNVIELEPTAIKLRGGDGVAHTVVSQETLGILTKRAALETAGTWGPSWVKKIKGISSSEAKSLAKAPQTAEVEVWGKTYEIALSPKGLPSELKVSTSSVDGAGGTTGQVGINAKGYSTKPQGGGYVAVRGVEGKISYYHLPDITTGTSPTKLALASNPQVSAVCQTAPLENPSPQHGFISIRLPIAIPNPEHGTDRLNESFLVGSGQAKSGISILPTEDPIISPVFLPAGNGQKPLPSVEPDQGFIGSQKDLEERWLKERLVKGWLSTETNPNIGHPLVTMSQGGALPSQGPQMTAGEQAAPQNTLIRHSVIDPKKIQEFLREVALTNPIDSILLNLPEGTPAPNLLLCLKDSETSPAPVAFVTAHFGINRVATVQTVYCNPAYRERGLERELIAGVIKCAEKSDCKEVCFRSLTLNVKEAVETCCAQLAANIVITPSSKKPNDVTETGLQDKSPGAVARFMQIDGETNASAFVSHMAKQKEPIPLLTGQPQGTPAPNMVITIRQNGEGKKIEAFAVVFVDKENNSATVQSIYCIPSARNRGHEQHLLSEVERVVQDSGCRSLNMRSRTTQMKREMDLFCAKSHTDMIINHEPAPGYLLALADYVIPEYEYNNAPTAGSRPEPWSDTEPLHPETINLLQQRQRDPIWDKYKQIFVSIGPGNCFVEKNLAETNPETLIFGIEPKVGDASAVARFIELKNTYFFNGGIEKFPMATLEGKVEKVYIFFPSYQLEWELVLNRSLKLLKPGGQLYICSHAPFTEPEKQNVLEALKGITSYATVEATPLADTLDCLQASSCYLIYTDPRSCFEYNQLLAAEYQLRGLPTNSFKPITPVDSFTLIRAIK